MLQHFDLQQSSKGMNVATIILTFFAIPIYCIPFGWKGLFLGVPIFIFALISLTKKNIWFIDFYEDKIVFRNSIKKEPVTLFINDIECVSWEAGTTLHGGSLPQLIFTLRSGEEKEFTYMGNHRDFMKYAKDYFNFRQIKSRRTHHGKPY